MTTTRTQQPLPSTKLCEAVSMTSAASVCDMAPHMKHGSYVRRVEGGMAPTTRSFTQPHVGQVPAGPPQLRQDEDDFQPLTIDDHSVPEPNRAFLAKVRRSR